MSFSLVRTRRFSQSPLPILLDCYERYGPVFSIRILHSPVVFMLGPEANHFLTVSNAAKFRWRDGSMGDLIPLLGDGMLTIDGPYHRQSRKVMLPSFHRERLDALIYEEIARRRSSDERRDDLMSVLLDATDDAGEPLSDREVRDHLITLLFAGHDTTTSTVTFLFYELLQAPEALARVTEELDRELAGRPPTAEQLVGGLPELEAVMDETLRMYPPAWVGPRRAVESFEFAGTAVPSGALVNYCSWASHRLPDIWPEPERFDPQRFAPENRER